MFLLKQAHLSVKVDNKINHVIRQLKKCLNTNSFNIYVYNKISSNIL